MLQLDYAQIKTIADIESFEDRVLAAAVMYAEAGFHVVPVRRNQKAIPPRETRIGYAAATNNPKTVRNWYKEGGKFHGWNVGLACGAENGIFVLDVDTKGDKDGRPALEEMQKDHGQFKTMRQITPSGGYHFVWQWFDGGTSSTEKLAKGIDTRGGKGRCSSHIVAWPSEIDGEPYQWECVGEVSDAPEFLKDLMGEPWQPQASGPGRGNENLDDSSVETQYTKRQIWDMLKKIDPDELTYDDWLNVGMAVHSQHPTEDGFRLWDAWSQKGNRYEPNECAARWSGFKNYGTVRVGTLIHFAKRGGYVPPPQLVKEQEQQPDPLDDEDEYTAMINAMNQHYGVVLVGSKIKIVPKAMNKDPERDLTLLSVDDFKLLSMNDKVTIVGAQGQPKVVPKGLVWLADERRKDYMGGIAFDPSEEREFETPNGLAFNLWQGWSREPKRGDWSKLRRHIEEIVCSGSEELATWVLDWMADLYQDPANPKGCALVMHGIEGCGKGTLIEAMGRTMGRHYKHLLHEKHLTGDFNGHLQDGLLVFADELVYGGSKKTAGTLKGMVTERMLMTERKGVDATRSRNCIHLAIASNEDWFVPAGPDARRWLVLEVSPERANDPDWFGAIYDEMDNGGVEAMMYDLMNREITSNLKRAPITASLERQQELYANSLKDTVDDWWDDALDRSSLAVEDAANEGDIESSWPDYVVKGALYDNYVNWCNARRVPYLQIDSRQLFYRKMDKYGLEEAMPKGKEVVKQLGGRRRCFRVPSVDEARAKFTKKRD